MALLHRHVTKGRWYLSLYSDHNRNLVWYIGQRGEGITVEPLVREGYIKEADDDYQVEVVEAVEATVEIKNGSGKIAHPKAAKLRKWWT